MESKMYNGIVVKVTSEYIVILCKDGKFKNVPRAKNEIPKIGQSFTYTEKQSYFFKGAKYLSLVSVVLLAIIGYYIGSLMKADESYLFAVDINPSIEIYTDEHLRVTNIHFLNEDGKVVVDSLRGKKENIHVILDALIHIAVEKNYLKKNEEGMVSLTVVPLKSNSKPIDKEIKETVEQSLKTNSITTVVSVKNGSKKLLNEARNVNLSINKYQIYKESKEKGINISLDELREKSIAFILNEVHHLNTGDQNENEIGLIQNDSKDEQKEKVDSQTNKDSNSNGSIIQQNNEKKLIE
jgi:hypothetical protein